MTGAALVCELCGERPMELLMHHRGRGHFAACFPCADDLMQSIAPDNVHGGSTVEETAAGYARWRAHVGRPCTEQEALAIVRERMSQ